MDSDSLRSLHTQYSDLLTGNDMASESELDHLKAVLSGWQANAHDINRTAEVLYLTVKVLLKQVEGIKKSIATFDPIFSPIRRVPDDVLGEIFYHCLPSHRNPIPITSKAPLVLTLVCRKWRRVAFSSPWLWTKLHFSFQSSVTSEKYDPLGVFNRQWQPRLNGIRYWLSRSYDLPLSISVKCAVVGTIRKESDHVEREAMQVIIDHAYHWQNLEISMSEYSFITFFNMININPTTVPILRSLRVAAEYMSREQALSFIKSQHYRLPSVEPYPLHRWLSLPTLRSAYTYINSEPVRRIQRLHHPPLIRGSSLSTLSMYHSTERNEISDILRACPFLEDCYLRVASHSEPLAPDLSMISLRNLKRLSISRERDQADSLWTLFDTPSLVELTLSEIGQPDSNTTTLSSFLLQCKSLDKVTFDPYTLPNRVLRSIIKSIPSVSHLQLDPCGCWKYGQRCHSKNSVAERQKVLTFLKSILDDGTDTLTTPHSNHWQETTLPRLKTFSAHIKLPFIPTTREEENMQTFLHLRTLLKRFIRPLSPSHSLQSVALVIEGRAELGGHHPLPPIDIDPIAMKYAESAGRTVGKDLFIDISYSWKDSSGKGGWNVNLCTTPRPFLSAKAGLDNQTDRTWPYPDY